MLLLIQELSISVFLLLKSKQQEISKQNLYYPGSKNVMVESTACELGNEHCHCLHCKITLCHDFVRLLITNSISNVYPTQFIKHLNWEHVKVEIPGHCCKTFQMWRGQGPAHSLHKVYPNNAFFSEDKQTLYLKSK